MNFRNPSYKRIRYPDSEPGNSSPAKQAEMIKFRCNGISLKPEMLWKIFSDDFKNLKKQATVDPHGNAIHVWSKLFLSACLISLFVDPLFLFLPQVQPSDQLCLEMGVTRGKLILTIIRSMADMFHVINIILRFRTAYVAPSSSVSGSGDLVVDPWKIGLRYITIEGFWLDLMAALPIPQVLIWVVLPNVKGSAVSNLKISLMFLMILQYLQRLFMAYPLTMQIAKATGIVPETAWLGAAYNLMLYLLSSHVMGSCLYLLTIQREVACWKSLCDQNSTSCNYEFFDCSTIGSHSRSDWIQSSNITYLCAPSSGNYPYGIYSPGVSTGVTTARFLQRYLYSLWVGLKSVSTLGQNFTTSIFIGENIFATIIVLLGLLNLALLVGNMQTYLQSITARLEEWRLKKRDKEQWMHHRQLPKELRESVRRYDRYKWVATQGVDEEALLKDLPKYLHRQIKRQLCLNLVRRVPFFDEMDDRMLDSICVRLKPTLWPAGMFVVREGDPLDEMLFIIRGHLDSFTTNGGQVGFFNSCHIHSGDFCSEELLTWALKSHPSDILPSSTRTVKAISDVEAFALGAEDLKFVASQFRRLHSKQLRHKLRFHSHQWRMWAACFIQAAWRRYGKRKVLGALYYEGRLGSFRGLGLHQNEMLVPQPSSDVVSPLPKPAELDFYTDED